MSNINPYLYEDPGDNNAENILRRLVNNLKTWIIVFSAIIGILYIITGCITGIINNDFIIFFEDILIGTIYWVLGYVFAKFIWALSMLFINISTNVRSIKHELQIYQNSSLTYLVSIGEIEKANKMALRKIIDKLRLIYYDPKEIGKVEKMNEFINEKMPKYKRMGLELPQYVQTGENFIKYMNQLTGNQV